MDGLTVGYLAERNARTQPDGDAVVQRADGERTEAETFEELNRRVDQLANALAERGIEAGATVATYTGNRIETIESYLATMKLGALPVPINHRFKAGEVNYVLEDSDAALCIFDEAGRETIAGVHDEFDSPVEEYLHVGESTPAFATDYETVRDDASADPVDVVPARADEAAIMYTSGTTGKPKGCVLTHDNVVQAAENSLYEVNLSRDARFMVVTPLFHIAAFGLFMMSFYVGGTTILVDDFEPASVLSVLEDESVTATFMVPMMSRAVLSADPESYDLSSFEHYMTGAAPSERSLKEAIIETFDCNLYDVFGQTELSPSTTMLRPENALEKPDSVGRPIINVEVKVVDEAGNEVETGEAGRIAYRGPTVFKEYYGMPEQTTEVFDDDWFVSDDLVRMDEDGFVYFVGRADDMIITGGENVHPAEIEEVLHDLEGVDEVAVVGVPDDQWGERVKAVVVPEDGAALSEDDVVDHVGANLAGFKKPREVEFRDELPRNPTGKVLKNELA
ncbi:AMP-dependent synthetase [Natrinema saccharevitans]|uniref:AMP-dependent synthetase n=1 Tax=Natrinema saccharevitans TaxID=301967 RepID=A0A1S8AQZ2_9EURY|nr:AMP-binding protein [Natrinema saccharevitans]OLZ39155.1 AMP-dependent synthetase [Natrinema saccharevitans]OLZ39439.1 AMP-dependent synthetase [Natrinema saccharevitans]